MLPQVPVVRVTDAQKTALPQYADGVGTCMVIKSSEINSVKIAPNHFEIFSTGIAIALPIGMEAQIRSLKESTQTGVIVLNAPVTIDASDRKEIKVCIFNASQESVIIKRGEPIALMVFSLAMRINWQDLTQQIVTKIKEQKAENQQKMQEQESLRNSIENAMPTLFEEGKPLDTSEQDHLELKPDILHEESMEKEAELEEFKPIDNDETIEELQIPSKGISDTLVEEGKEKEPSLLNQILQNQPVAVEKIEAPETIPEFLSVQEVSEANDAIPQSDEPQQIMPIFNQSNKGRSFEEEVLTDISALENSEQIEEIKRGNAISETTSEVAEEIKTGNAISETTSEMTEEIKTDNPISANETEMTDIQEEQNFNDEMTVSTDEGIQSPDESTSTSTLQILAQEDMQAPADIETSEEKENGRLLENNFEIKAAQTEESSSNIPPTIPDFLNETIVDTEPEISSKEQTNPSEQVGVETSTQPETLAQSTSKSPEIFEDEPVAPPAILEEFEKIESEYQQNHLEDKN